LSIDWIIDWQEDAPTAEDIQNVAGDFFRDIGEIEIPKSWSSGFIISLPGNQTHPLRRVAAFNDLPHINYEESRGRWIEVFVDDRRITITTRSQDEVTNCLAGGLARCYARVWKGGLVEPS